MNTLPSIRPCGIALGSNLGDRAAAMTRARNLLQEQFGSLRQSGLYATKPQNCPPGSPDYINAVVELDCGLEPEELLQATQHIERELGRTRTGVYGEPRTVDLDILYMGKLTHGSPSLTLPHPRLHLRRFVLRPLADIRPGLLLPGQTSTVRELLDTFPSGEPEPELIATHW